MRLTTFSDYTLRTLMYLAAHPDRFVTIAEIAGAYGISSNHLMKVAQHLARGGMVVTLRGPRGGLRLAAAAGTIRVGDVIRGAEPDLAPPGSGDQPDGVLAGVFDRALGAFMAVLDACSVADLVGQPDELWRLLNQAAPAFPDAPGSPAPSRPAKRPPAPRNR